MFLKGSFFLFPLGVLYYFTIKKIKKNKKQELKFLHWLKKNMEFQGGILHICPTIWASKPTL